MRVLVAMSGGVDSSVAAALLVDQLGPDGVVGATLKLWGGTSDSGCCSVSDVDDARRVADALGITHRVFNFADDFEAHVVGPYAAAHAAGATPNPCIECNRHLKFDRLLDRARRLGFDAVATGHHARVERDARGAWRLARGADPAKDQSYVLAMLGQDQLSACRFPVGAMTKAEVRAEAARRGLRTAAKPDSQDVCFIRSDVGRERFLAGRIALTPGELVDPSGDVVGEVGAVELVTVGQRRGMGHAADGRRRYVTRVDVGARRVHLGPPEDAVAPSTEIGTLAWVDGPVPVGAGALAQCSAHGRPVACRIEEGSSAGTLTVVFGEPQRRTAPGQTIALYDPDRPEWVLGSGIAR